MHDTTEVSNLKESGSSALNRFDAALQFTKELLKININIR